MTSNETEKTLDGLDFKGKRKEPRTKSIVAIRQLAGYIGAMDNKLSPDQLIEDLGGCGRFQIRLSILIHSIKTAIAWSLFTMTIMAKTPAWWCVDDFLESNMTHSNTSRDMLKSCLNRNGTMCKQFAFDNSLWTIVSEFNLVCDKAFIPSTIMSIQLAGMAIGNPLSGQVADLIGRKKPIFISLTMLTVFNLVAYFSTDWIMFAVCRFIIGLGTGFFLTVQYNLMSEFSLASWRSWITGFPSWPIQAALLIFIAWLLHDWQYLHLVCCGVSALFLLSWQLVPESFRWHLSHDRHAEAERILQGVAKVNKRPLPDLEKFTNIDVNKEGDHKKYTFLHLFKTREIAKVTILIASNWFALGFVAYGLLFGVQALSGNLFLNMLLFTITGVPVKFLGSWLVNKIGRKKTSIACFIVTCIGGLVVGIVQQLDIEYRDDLTNGFALCANMGITTAWGSVQTMTIELYPTVIRNIGFGSLSTIGRIGAVLGPQMVFLDLLVPGILYFACGGISFVCIIALMFLPETKGGNLPDKIKDVERVINPV